MKPGEYIGVNGQIYRWEKRKTDHCYYGISVGNTAIFGPDVADWPDAKAALDTLIEEGAGEWVYWEGDNEPHYQYRATPDGSRVEWLPPNWQSCEADEGDAYRKGRSVALEECEEKIRHLETELGISDTASQCAQDRAYASEKRYRELAERVQELVEAIEEVGGFAYPSIPEWHRVCDLARKVKL